MPPKKPRKPQPDQHTSGYLIRLPESFREPLLKLKAKHRRPTTTEVRIALEKHFREEGVGVPPG